MSALGLLGQPVEVLTGWARAAAARERRRVDQENIHDVEWSPFDQPQRGDARHDRDDRERTRDRERSVLIVDQREANSNMVEVALRAQQLTEEAHEALAAAEATTTDVRASEERYRALFDLSPVAVYSCDATGLIQKYNRHAAELWGREPSPGDTSQRFCGSLKLLRLDGTDLPHDECPMADVARGLIPAVCDGEVQIERPDGSRVTVANNVHPLTNERGDVVGAINCFHDITARKLVENQRDAALIRERELAEFRELFIGVVGHDLRNPLSSILMAAELLTRPGKVQERDTETAARIISSAQRMTSLIAQLLDLTKARLGGGFPVERKRTNLRELSARVLGEFEVPTELQIDGDVVGDWDENRLEEALSNLVGNAIEHATRGTPVVVKVRSVDNDVVVDVSNSGLAIPADVLPFIFEPFRRGRQGEKSVAGNLGLGLYIAHEIVASHGGVLAVSCVAGTTTFSMRLPRGAPVLWSKKEITGAAVVAVPRRILLVDDSPDLRSTFRRVLELRGHHVTEASDGFEGLAMILADKPDVAIVDIGLPGIDGLEVARRARAEGAGMRLVAMTGHAAEPDRLAALAAGFDMQLTKPVDIALIEQMLATVAVAERQLP
ncbi:MAG: response regulator [Deltaproteobacteria bacterium]|nr:response regulator [Deltaproteobacteria bacterium]